MTSDGPDAATLQVELCGKLADQHGATVDLSIPDRGCTAGVLLARVAKAYPDLASIIAQGRVRVCVNDAVISQAGAVNAGDRVALFPPVSGG